MLKALQTLRAVQWSMLASIVLYGVAGEVIGPAPRGVDPALSYLFATLSVAIVGSIFVVRRTLVFRAGESSGGSPRRQPEPEPLENGLHCDLCVVRGAGVVRSGASPSRQPDAGERALLLGRLRFAFIFSSETAGQSVIFEA